MRRSFLPLLIAVLFASGSQAQTIYTLNVEVIQVCDDAGGNCTNLGPNGGTDLGYLYESQFNEIWEQAGIGVNYSVTQWDNTEAQRLTLLEREQVYNNTFSSTSGSTIPDVAIDALQVFFVNDHPGTGFSGPGTGWGDNPLPNPNSSARNAGNAQLSIDGSFSSNGRVVVSNEGFTSDQLSGTLTHEIGHALGLRHVEDVNGGASAGTTQDPNFTVAAADANLMWGGGRGPSFDDGMTLVENFDLNRAQIDAAIFNGLRLDPDGNGVGVLQVVTDGFDTGDFDLDGDVDVDDIDAYVGKIGLATGEADFEAALDLDNDGQITLDDYNQHVTQLVETSNSQTGTFIGDINLDGTVDIFGDGFVLLGQIGNNSAGWGDGDLNASGTVDIFGDGFAFLDNIGNSNTAAGAPSASAVPEPGSLALLAIVSATAGLRRRKR